MSNTPSLFASCGGLKCHPYIQGGGACFRKEKMTEKDYFAYVDTKIPASIQNYFCSGNILSMFRSMGTIKNIVSAPCGGFYLDGDQFENRDGVLTLVDSPYSTGEYFYANCGGLKCDTGDFKLIDDRLMFSESASDLIWIEFLTYPKGIDFNVIVKNLDGDIIVPSSPGVYHLNMDSEGTCIYTATSPDYPDITVEDTFSIGETYMYGKIIVPFDADKHYQQTYFMINPPIALKNMEIKNEDTGEIVNSYFSDVPNIYLLPATEGTATAYTCSIDMPGYEPYNGHVLARSGDIIMKQIDLSPIE